jgi:murein L,D-transpeptidase YcbB/YkuD
VDDIASLAAGQVEPATTTPAWRVPPPRPPSDSQLAGALRQAPSQAAAEFRPSGPGYDALRAAFAQYRAAAAGGEWALPDTAVWLRPGVRDSATRALRRRLIRTGDLPAPDSVSLSYDSALQAAVRRAQHRLGLSPDGLVGPVTWQALAVPAAARAQAIAVNLERYRWLPDDGPGTTLIVDAAAGTLELRHGGDLLVAGAARLDAACADDVPPILADTVAEVRPLAGGMLLRLAGGRSLRWAASGGWPAACVRADSVARLVTILRGASEPVLLYLVAPTAQVASDGRVQFRRDPGDADRPLAAALAAMLSRTAPPVCAVTPDGVPPARDAAKARLPALPPTASEPAGRRSVRPAD